MMKKLFGLLLIATSLTGFTACDDDDDKMVEIAGTYLGEMNTKVTVMGAEVPVKQSDVEATLTKEGDTYTVTIKSFTYNDYNYGNIVVSDVTLEDEDSFIGQGECALTKNDVSYTAAIEDLEGEKSGKNVTIEFDMKLPVSPKMTILFDVTYTGSETQK